MFPLKIAHFFNFKGRMAYKNTVVGEGTKFPENIQRKYAITVIYCCKSARQPENTICRTKDRKRDASKGAPLSYCTLTTINCMKLNVAPTQKGAYIFNGKKVLLLLIV